MARHVEAFRPIAHDTSNVPRQDVGEHARFLVGIRAPELEPFIVRLRDASRASTRSPRTRIQRYSCKGRT